MCQETNHTQKKLGEKSGLQTGGFGLNLSAIFVKRLMKKRSHIMSGANFISVIKDVKSLITKVLNFTNKLITGVLEKLVTLSGFIQRDIKKTIQKELHILRREDTQEKRMQTVRTRLKNGKTCVRNLVTNVPCVLKKRNLRKTTLNHCRLEGVITLQTYNHFVGTVTAESGKLFTRTQN